MINPKQIDILKEGVSYIVPIYAITNEGAKDSEPYILNMAKGDKSDESKFRQTGFFTESLIQVAIVHLKAVNQGELTTRETSLAITKLEEALMWLNARAEDRKLRNVEMTYNK